MDETGEGRVEYTPVFVSPLLERPVVDEARER